MPMWALLPHTIVSPRQSRMASASYVYCENPVPAAPLPAEPASADTTAPAAPTAMEAESSAPETGLRVMLGLQLEPAFHRTWQPSPSAREHPASWLARLLLSSARDRTPATSSDRTEALQSSVRACRHP